MDQVFTGYGNLHAFAFAKATAIAGYGIKVKAFFLLVGLFFRKKKHRFACFWSADNFWQFGGLYLDITKCITTFV